MNGVLVRVGADLSSAGGSWNGPVNVETGEFAYVAIPESVPVHTGLEKPYATLTNVLAKFDVTLPQHLRQRDMHLDPDFTYLTYGDQGQRAKQLQATNAGDFILFYAGLKPINGGGRLVYALIGIFVVETIFLAADVPLRDRDINAHCRRVLKPGTSDLIVRGRTAVSGRLDRCLPIGEYRDRAYRVRRDLLEAWGGLSVKDGYLQRSARLPRLLNPPRFLRWLDQQKLLLRQSNN